MCARTYVSRHSLEYPIKIASSSTFRRFMSAASCPLIRYFSVVLALPPCVVFDEGISFVIVRPSSDTRINALS
ncbi:hypothetical protein CY34DRAFT_805049 [Suillus luteus UH-Slu-Lm8-n1]|uniref:Uncharacterized protein n=1 Tax=Suillus luteus UH-Slu-Lm8-n1 TaxID=930992 RepID=A0A0D0AWT4_9AGAM|nr:hypothetical protein CY34DRAFT_805049 [Suillus luteus UH-Slu-Lm8-n1]